MSGYNGWSNYETWNVALWVDNEYAVYLCREEEGKRRSWTAKNVEYFVREMFPTGTGDITKSDYSKVDWQEIADNWNEDREEEDDEE